MAVPTTKEQLLAAIDKNYRLLQVQIHRFPLSQVQWKVMDGHAQGTQMSLHNLVSYLLGWGQLVLFWQKNKQDITGIDFPAVGYKWNELGKLAQKFYKDYEELSFEVLVMNLEMTVEEILKNIKQTTSVDLYETPWYGKWTLGRMIQFNTASPYNNAKNRISKHLKST